MRTNLTAHTVATARQRQWYRSEAYGKIQKFLLIALAFLIVGAIIFAAAYLCVAVGTGDGVL